MENNGPFWFFEIEPSSIMRLGMEMFINGQPISHNAGIGLSRSDAHSLMSKLDEIREIRSEKDGRYGQPYNPIGHQPIIYGIPPVSSYPYYQRDTYHVHFNTFVYSPSLGAHRNGINIYFEPAYIVYINYYTAAYTDIRSYGPVSNNPMYSYNVPPDSSIGFPGYQYTPRIVTKYYAVCALGVFWKDGDYTKLYYDIVNADINLGLFTEFLDGDNHTIPNPQILISLYNPRPVFPHEIGRECRVL